MVCLGGSVSGKFREPLFRSKDRRASEQISRGKISALYFCAAPEVLFFKNLLVLYFNLV